MHNILRFSRLRDTGIAASLFIFSIFGAASAAPYTDFSLDLAASSVTIGDSSCWPGCGVSANINTSLANSGTNLDFSFDSLNDSLSVPNLIEWVIDGTGLGVFAMALDLVFTAPDAQTSSSNGVGAIATFWGVLSAGYIEWSNPAAPVTFNDGSELQVSLHEGVYASLDPYNWGGPGIVRTGLTFTPTSLSSLNTPSPVPLPAALPALLVMGLGALGLGWRRRKSSPTSLPA
ncbi:PEP-CTERM sorting domain-containing protein [Sulfitobacter sp. S223]|uniref:PEP-CTERM sorting domain-containing protein n=1 Tax=Sulfitobacter sp. S223 TaxID=2867023 RepID=UPI0021A635D5|nr:PEP-CTERM sorting domain-containing protein [Sulfitobacter sp. S223]UWR25806.1 PEP-CTERM sorting domain-containing protein [Sulfitobacter sp. S223]